MSDSSSWAFYLAWWQPALALVFVLLLTIASYRLYLHPPAKFPGPKLAAITRYYEAYYDINLSGEYIFKISKLHQKYGMTPDSLHLYSRDGVWDKYTWSYDAFGAPLSTICAIKHDVHKMRRAALNPYFSKANVASKQSKQSIIIRAAEKLCFRMDCFADVDTKRLSLRAFTSAVARDVGTEFILGKCYHDVETLDFDAETAFVPRNVKICSDIHNSYVNGSLDPDAPETTATTLRLVLFNIHSDAVIIRKLRTELRAARWSSHSLLSLSELEQLPYLTAVLKEGLRLSPGVATRTARIAPDRDSFYGKLRIPSGTPIGITAFLIHRDPRLYSAPDQFDPSRLCPFLKRTRNCLGMHLAWAELYIVVAAIVENFDLQFESTAIDEVICKTDEFTIGTISGSGLPVRVKRPHTKKE
ncbi:trichodiene oxygenase [Xylariaceae sp. FL1272]|nr:trichodiene oxygenase [Xylariaceae sp. FL1272]